MSAIAPLARNSVSIPGKELLNAALQACAEGIAVVEMGRIVHANPAFASMYGYAAARQIQGAELADFVPDNRPCTEHRAGPPNCGYPVCEFVARTRDGSAIRVQASCVPVRAEGRDLLVITARNLEKVERRRVVRGSDKQFRAMFEAAAIGIVQCGLDGRVTECNPAAARMLGYSRAELRGKHFRAFIHPDDLAQDLELFEEMVGGRRDYYQIELRYVRKDQATGWVRLTVSLVRGPDRTPECAIGMIEDITESKRTEQRLREAYKLEAVGRLAGGVAHDFNNLLTGILLYSDLTASVLDSNSRALHYAQEIRSAAEHGAALTQQLLAVARQQVTKPRILQLGEVVLGIGDLLERFVGENIELVIDLVDDLWPVRMDPAQAQQILLNLVSNSRDAMPDGGRITLSVRNSEICSSISEQGSIKLTPCIEFTVADTGCGMSEDTQRHLFEPFFTTKQPGRGNGLGLSTVQSVVNEAGGSISVESTVGQGTRVVLYLPCAEGTVPRPAGSLPIPLNGSETLLLVEDDSAVRISAQRVLSQFGYHVLEASSGAEAQQICSTHAGPIDLLITDLIMPAMNGQEAARLLSAARPGMRVLYISGFYDRANDAAELQQILLRKPFTGEVLARKVRALLDQPVSDFVGGGQP